MDPSSIRHRVEPEDPTNSFQRHIVLINPQIHWNTGNIGRTCLGTDSFLHLVKPLGFSLEESQVKRAGLDYWNKVKLSIWESIDDFLTQVGPGKNEIALFSKTGSRPFRQMQSPKRLFLVFGSETAGLPKSLVDEYAGFIYHIPTTRAIRCLNLSTAVGIALYESLKGCSFHHDWV